MCTHEKRCERLHIVVNISKGGPPQNPEFIKNCVFIFTCLNFSDLQGTLHLMQYTYQDFFSTAQNSFEFISSGAF